jgi:hypothetical protein
MHFTCIRKQSVLLVGFQMDVQRQFALPGFLNVLMIWFCNLEYKMSSI